ncbi:MAG: hypothetical protein HC866_21915 [Leptolyngbyaceae cyanobacterium RU_5_1]|nr:hypothetical protein [Leptolyngbyaceae cyanobacterium RU_5_1]
MTRPQILQPGESYTFSKYFELTFDPEDILAELGCTLEKAPLSLVKHLGELSDADLKQRIEQNLTYVDLTSEAARREVLIAPVLLEVCRYTNARLKIEYPIVVNNLLKGSVDYYLLATHNLLVVEAKNADLARGFTQLAVELIALDQWITSDAAVLHGAVTAGDVWKFGTLNRQERRIVQDINLYRVPADLDELLRIIVGILS